MRKTAPRNYLDTLRRVSPENSPSRGSKMWYHIKRDQAVEPRLGKRRAVSARSEILEHVTFRKTVR
jgi:hypothetical protein